MLICINWFTPHSTPKRILLISYFIDEKPCGPENSSDCSLEKAFKLRSNRKQDWGQDLSAPRVWDLKQHSVFFLFLCQEIQQISYLDDKNEESNPKVLNVRVLSRSVVSDSRDLIDCSLPGSCLWDSSGKNTGVGCHFLLQGIFLTQEPNPDLLYCRQILYQMSHKGSPQWGSWNWGPDNQEINVSNVWRHLSVITWVGEEETLLASSG